MAKFTDIFSDETKRGHKLQTSEYLPLGKYPIIDQGQSQIIGYTNLENGLFTDVPAIIFGDHTRIVKYVDSPFFLGADGVKVLKVKVSDADYKYLFYCLQNVKIPNTGYNRHFKWLKEANIPLPDLDKQRKIAAVLDKVSDLIAKHRQQLDKLDELVKSQFMEQFGNLGKNSKGFPMMPVADVCEELFAGGDKPADNAPEMNDEYPYPVYSNGEGPNGLLCFSRDYRVSKEAITISARGTIGYSAIREPFFTPVVRLLTVVPKANMNIIFLKYYIDASNLTGTGSSQGQLTLPEFKKLVVPIPPMDLQEQFAAFVRQSDKSKLTIKQSIEKLETLKKSLMQQYFG